MIKFTFMSKTEENWHIFLSFWGNERRKNPNISHPSWHWGKSCLNVDDRSIPILDKLLNCYQLCICMSEKKYKVTFSMKILTFFTYLVWCKCFSVINTEELRHFTSSAMLIYLHSWRELNCLVLSDLVKRLQLWNHAR